MIEFTQYIFSKISIYQIHILGLLGLVLFGGTIGGRLFQKIKIPQVVGYITIGLILGQSGFNVIDKTLIEALEPLSHFALGLIGLMIGSELKKEVFDKYGKQFLYILFLEGFVAFLVVFLLVGFIGSFFIDDSLFIWSLAVILGAIASATAPAATTDVLWEYKTRGPLTTTILGIVALDDALALILFSVASSIVGRVMGMNGDSMTHLILQPFHEIGTSIIIGVVSGFILSKILRNFYEEDRILQFSLGMVLLVLGLSLTLHVDMILSAMALGAVLVNYTPRKSKEVFKLVKGFAPPIYVLFFVLVGAKIVFNKISGFLFLLVMLYLLGRAFGKMGGSFLGAKLSAAPKTVQKYLPFCLFSQAGVAIGLSILAYQRFPGDIGAYTVMIVTTSTFFVQIFGPAFTRMAIKRAGEVGLNITEEDLIRETNAKDFMDTNPPIIYETMNLSQILKLFSESSYLYYPVLSEEKELKGILTVEEIKDTIMEADLNQFLLAHDMMEPIVKTVNPETPMQDVQEEINRYNLDCLPVVDNQNKLLGFIETKLLKRSISTKIIERHKKAEALA